VDWARFLAYVTGSVDQELLTRNDYLAAENRIMKAQLNCRLKLSDVERGVLGEIGHRLGRKVLADVATIARPDTILGWYRKLIARKFDGACGVSRAIGWTSALLSSRGGVIELPNGTGAVQVVYQRDFVGA
jgi:hypothetical protein